MSESETLGRFGHHPDPAIDFCVEVEEIEAIWTDRCLKVANPDDADLEARVGAAMAFRVGGDLHAINAKDRVRLIVASLDEELFAHHDRMRAAAPDLHEALKNLLNEHHAGDCECDRGIGPSMTHPGEPPSGPPCAFCEARAALSKASQQQGSTQAQGQQNEGAES